MDIRLVGKRDGFPVVALHGIQGTSDSWVPLATSLGDTFRFILPNMPGRAKAPDPASPQACSAAEFAHLTSKVIAQEIGDRPYVLAGWSMGVSVILELMAHLAHGTARHPAPAAVILMSGTAQLNDVEWFASTDDGPLLDEIAQRETRLGLANAARPHVVAWTWRALRPVSHLANLALVNMPTLIVHGSDDEDCPAEHARRMHAGIRGASLHMIPGAGHSILTKHTQEVRSVVADFLTQYSAASAPPATPKENS